MGKGIEDGLFNAYCRAHPLLQLNPGPLTQLTPFPGFLSSFGAWWRLRDLGQSGEIIPSLAFGAADRIMVGWLKRQRLVI